MGVLGDSPPGNRFEINVRQVLLSSQWLLSHGVQDAFPAGFCPAPCVPHFLTLGITNDFLHCSLHFLSPSSFCPRAAAGWGMEPLPPSSAVPSGHTCPLPGQVPAPRTSKNSPHFSDGHISHVPSRLPGRFSGDSIVA